MRIGLIYSFILIACSACLKEQPYIPTSPFKSNLVVHAYITDDSATEIWVGNSTGILQKDTPNSSTSLFIKKKNGVLESLTQVKPGYFKFYGTKLIPGDSFVLKCINSAISFDKSSAVPYKPKIITIDTLHRINPLVGNTLNVDFTLLDSAALKNFYRIFISKKYYQYIYDYNGVLLDSFIANKRIPIYGQAIPFAQNDYNKYTNEEILFTDATFNGVKQKLNIYTNDLLRVSKQQYPLEIKVVIEALSEDLYHFYNVRNAHIWQQKSIIQAPSKVTGNEKDVLGVVGAYSKVLFTYKLN